MADRDLVDAFRYGVYTAIQEVPYGKVTTYAQIAYLIGEPQRPRQVGACLKGLPSADSETVLHSGNVPWHRVINSKGLISHRSPVGAARRQAEALREEGVEVNEDAMGEFLVDLKTHGWFPDVLPSEEPQRPETPPLPPPRRSRDQSSSSRRRRKESSRRSRAQEPEA